MRMFLSDNNSGVHKDVLQALSNCNVDHEYPYGDDQYTKRTTLIFDDLFGKKVDTYFVTNGTSANVLGLSGLINRHEGVIACDTAHINVDECGAFERFTGCKILYVPNVDGKLTVENAKKMYVEIDNEHHVQPKVIYISQTTETGTVYSKEEVKAIADFAHENNMYLFLDGARISNALASTGLSVKEMIIDTGVDVMSFGGTKNGMMIGDAIISLRPELSKHFKYVRKQGMQLISKMRFVSAQFEAYLNNDLYIKNATHSNEMAMLLANEISKIEEVEILAEVKSNIIFAKIPESWNETLWEKYLYYVIYPESNTVRFVTSFDTSREEVLDFANSMKKQSKY